MTGRNIFGPADLTRTAGADGTDRGIQSLRYCIGLPGRRRAYASRWPGLTPGGLEAEMHGDMAGQILCIRPDHQLMMGPGDPDDLKLSCQIPP